MGTFTKTIMVLFVLSLAACHKDDAPQPKDPDPVQQPDPKPEPEPENRPPGSFVLISPVQDILDEQPAPLFSWNTATDPDGDTVSYDLYLDTAEVPQTRIAENLNTATFALEERLDFKTKYHWKVVAKDTNGAETESIIGSFTTDLPIAFLREFSTFSPNSQKETIQHFVYKDGIVDAYERFQTRWATNHDIASNKLSALSTETMGEFITYTYQYTTFGAQRRIQRERSANTESWTLDYEGQRIASVSYRSITTGGDDFTATSIFHYPDGETSKPERISTEATGTTALHFSASIATLEWAGENIVSVLTERAEGTTLHPYLLEEYSYDDNLNAYGTITKNQFGFDDFFVQHIRTEMESINFDTVFWQSANNIVKIERYDDPMALEPFVTLQYEYEYTNDYYPKTAAFKTITKNATNVDQLKWTY